MAYPDYSVVIISVTEGGVTTDFSKAFFNDELANKYYKQAISEGKRAFYYERPSPSKFNRNDQVPLVENVEKSLELLPVETPSLAGNNGQPTISREDSSYSISFSVETALNAIENFQTSALKNGERIYNVYSSGWRKIREFIGIEYMPVLTNAATLTFSNKTIVIKHNGEGGFIPPIITKLWPSMGDYVDGAPIPQFVEIESTQVQVGTKIVRSTYDGTQFGVPSQSELFQWVPAGTIIRTSSTEDGKYTSNGNGGYDFVYDTTGTVYSQVSQSNIMFNLNDVGGPYQEFVIGTSFVELVANGQGQRIEATRAVYLPSGNLLLSTETTNYKTNGSGGVNSEERPSSESIMYETPCGPVTVGYSTRSEGNVWTNEYISNGTELTRCGGLIYYSNGEGGVYTEPYDDWQPPPPPPDEYYYGPLPLGQNEDSDESGKNYLIASVAEYGSLFNGLGVPYDAEFNYGTYTWEQLAENQNV